MDNLKKLSVCSLGATALTLGSVFPIHAQTLQAQTTQNLNLRIGPSTKNSVIQTIKKGSLVEVLENLDTWTIVKYQGCVGYVSSQYLTQDLSHNKPSDGANNNDNDTTTIMECNIDTLDVRKGPSSSDLILGKLNKTDRVYVIYQGNNGWSRIKYGNQYGYVISQYLSNIKLNPNPTPDESATMQCNTNSLNIRKGPSASEKVIGHLKYGDKINVVANLNNNWSTIKFNGKYAYVNSKYLSTIVPKNDIPRFMKCNAAALNVRSGPSTTENLIGKLKKDDKVEVVYHINSGWTRIKFNDGYAYVASSFLTNI